MMLQRNHKKLHVFSNEIRTKHLFKNLRQGSLKGNVLDVRVKLYYWEFIIKQNIAVQIIKVKK